MLKRNRQRHGAIASAKSVTSVLFLFLRFPFQSFFYFPLTLPLLSLTNIMNCIQYVDLRLRGLHFHIDGFLGKLENWMLLSWFFPFFPLSNSVGRKLGRIKSNDPKEAFYLKPCSHICQSSTLMNYVRGREMTIIGADREWYTGVEAVTHTYTHTPPLKENAIERQDHSKIH